MNKEDLKALAQDDLRLFSHGACHVFAIVLIEKFPSEGYSLRQIEHNIQPTERLIGDEWIPQNRSGGHHVYVVRDKFMVEVFGIRREKDYLTWVAARLRTQGIDDPNVVSGTVTTEELLKKHKIHHLFGEQNKWEHGCSPDFIVEAKRRAVVLIDECHERYKASMLTKM